MSKPASQRHFLEFEKPIAELEGKIEELRKLSEADGLNIADEVARLTEKADRQLRATYAKLSAWQKTQVARHPDRPHTLDYFARLITEYTPLSGDRAFGEDAAVVGGLGRFRGHAVMVLGTERGSDTESRVAHNFGMSRPEGYRKARRLIELAGRFGLPVLTFVDTSGAYPGVDAEARGQAEAIARSIEACLDAPVPVIATVIGEGGSGGAIALAGGRRGDDAGAFDLLGDHPGRLRRHPVEGRSPGAGGGRGIEIDRRGPAAPETDRQRRPRAARRRASRSRSRHRRGGRGDPGGAATVAGAGWCDAAGESAAEIPRHGARGPGLRRTAA